MHLSFLRPLYADGGPVASVYLDARRDTPDAGRGADLRWRAARERLEADGADAETVRALEAEFLRHTGARGLAMFAGHGRVRLAEPLPAPPRTEIAAHGPLPHAMPLVAQRGERVPWVRVVVDHAGADVLGMTEGGVARRGSVEGPEQFPIRKVKPGGWSAPRYQRAAEVTWERNAAEVAEAVAELADETGAEILVVAGDPRSRPLLIEHLPTRWQTRVVETDRGSRAVGADPEQLDDVTLVAVAECAAERTTEVIDRFGMEWGRGEAAASGLPAVVGALQRGQVDTLLLVDDPSSTAELWIGPEPMELSFDPEELRALGVAEPVRARADAALVRALVCSDADLALVGPDDAALDGGVGAVLRYADAATRRR